MKTTKTQKFEFFGRKLATYRIVLDTDNQVAVTRWLDNNDLELRHLNRQQLRTNFFGEQPKTIIPNGTSHDIDTFVNTITK